MQTEAREQKKEEGKKDRAAILRKTLLNTGALEQELRVLQKNVKKKCGISEVFQKVSEVIICASTHQPIK